MTNLLTNECQENDKNMIFNYGDSLPLNNYNRGKQKLQARPKGVIISTNFTRRPIKKQFVTGQMKKNTPMQTMCIIFMLNLESLGCQ